MYDNIKELVQLVEERSTAHSSEGKVMHAFTAGYYESMLSHLAKDIPEAAEFIQRRVNYLRNQRKAEAA